MASLVGQSERIAGYQAAPSERLNPQPRFLTCVGFRHSTGTPYADKRLMLLTAQMDAVDADCWKNHRPPPSGSPLFNMPANSPNVNRMNIRVPESTHSIDGLAGSNVSNLSHTLRLVYAG